MTFDSRDAAVDEVTKAMAFITEVVGHSKLEKRWAELESQRRSTVRGAHVAEVYGLELAHNDAVKGGALQFGWPSPKDDPPLLRLYGLAVAFHRLHAVSGGSARKQLKGSLRGKYLDGVGLRPLAYELSIAQHLSRMGFQIGFHDLEQAGGFDFLAVADDGVEIEIECKHLSADVGRKIHRREAQILFELMRPVLVENIGVIGEGQVLIVEVPDRLEASRPRMDGIVDLAAIAIHSSARQAASEVATVSLQEEDPKRPCTIWNSGLHHGARFGHFSIVLRSAKEDDVIGQIAKKLKDDAKRQFSKTRPAVLFAHVSDLTGDQLVELERAQKDGVIALQLMTSRILDSLGYLSAVSLTTSGEPVAETGPGNPISDRGVTFGFSKLSNDHPAYTAVRRAILGPDAGKTS